MAARIKAVLPYASSTAFTLALCVPASALTVSVSVSVSEMTSSRNEFTQPCMANDGNKHFVFSTHPARPPPSSAAIWIT
jgi:hypothetical protein